MFDLDLVQKIYTESRVLKTVWREYKHDKSSYGIVTYLAEWLTEEVIMLYLVETDAIVRHGATLGDMLKLGTEFDSKLVVTDWMKSGVYLISDLGDSGRYEAPCTASADDVAEILTNLYEFLEVNGISEHLLREVTASFCKDMKQKYDIDTQLPAAFNVLYKLYGDAVTQE